MNAWELLKHLVREFLMWLDAGINGVGLTLIAIVMALVTRKPQNPAYVDEMLSSHAWRAAERNKRWGRFFLPIIDFMFSWQTPDVNDEYGNPIRSHCRRAFIKEKQRRYLPPEYRTP